MPPRARPRAAARWRALLGVGDRAPGGLRSGGAREVRARRSELARWARLADLPEGEVVASPFGARMIALGLEAGATGVQHELRPLLAWDRSLLPDDAVSDPLHGVWHRGALRTGKYQEFCQEEPFCTYHPEHSAKWAPHEHLHRAVGFFHAPGASGFERYLGARLNELLPVATWYGLEHALRLEHDGAFDREREGREPGATTERARWLRESERALRSRARAAAPLVRWTLERARAELDAIDRELASGSIVASSDAGRESFAGVRLDASSDALAYLHAHQARLESPSVSRVLVALAAQRHEDVRSLRTQVERSLDALLFSPLRLAPRTIERRILANALHDSFLRVAIRGDAAFRSCAPLLPRAKRLAERLRRGSLSPPDAGSVRALLDAMEERLARASSPREARAISTSGLRGPIARVSLDTLARGLRTVAPATLTRLTSLERKSLASAIASDVTSSRLLLADRVAQHLRESSRLPASDRRALADLARLESALSLAGGVEPRVAWSISHLRAPPGSLVALDARASILHFATDALGAHRGEPLAERPISLVLARLDDGLHLVEISSVMAELLEPLAAEPAALQDFQQRAGRPATRVLCELGMLLVLPPIRRR